MSLSFLHPGLVLVALGAALIPVIIHLLLKQQPRPVVFPALKLLKRKHNELVRRVNLRHWILLACRIALIGLLGLALARPSLHSKLFSIDQNAPLHAVIIVDSSLSMQYREKGKTRLELAQEQGDHILDRLPEGSIVSVIDSSLPAQNPPLDVASARTQIHSVEANAVARTLNESVAMALRSLEKSTFDRREIFILSDLASHAWDLADSGTQELAKKFDPPVQVYAISVAAESVENISLLAPKLSHQVMSSSADSKISMQIANNGPDIDKVVELSLDGQPRDTKAVRLVGSAPTELNFSLGRMEDGFHQGKLSINASDNLAFDDARYFTVEIRPPTRVILVADQPADALFFQNALEPKSAARERRSVYQIEVIPAGKLSGTELSQGNVVCLLNVENLPADGWIQLSNFVLSGGGLFIGMGERVDSVSYNSPAAQAIMPCQLGETVRSETPTQWIVDKFTHPIFAKFKDWGTNEFADLPIYQYFKIGPLSAGTETLVRYGDGGTAVLERNFAAIRGGKVILWTTAAHHRPEAKTWSELPLGWSFVAVADQMTRYLAGAAEARWNVIAGQPLSIPLPMGQAGGLFTVTDPAKGFERITVEPALLQIDVPIPKLVGNYQVETSDAAKRFSCAFSVNEPVEESTLTPLDPEKLGEYFGKDRFSFARDPSELEEVVGEGRVGRELFSWIMLLVIAVLSIEGYVANRFYRKAATDTSRQSNK